MPSTYSLITHSNASNIEVMDKFTELVFALLYVRVYYFLNIAYHFYCYYIRT